VRIYHLTLILARARVCCNPNTQHKCKTQTQNTNANANANANADFGNNTLLFPARSAGHWAASPEDVQGIVYFTDWDSSLGGGTAIVPGLRHSVDSRLDQGIADPSPQLYDNERQVGYTKGSILLYVTYLGS
jgi:hypothetical protein